MNTMQVQRTKRKFDPTSMEDLLEYKNFLANAGWKGICPFQLEWPFVSIPDMIASKIAIQVVSTL